VGEEVIYVRFDILRKQDFIRQDNNNNNNNNGICGSRCDRFHIDVEGGGFVWKVFILIEVIEMLGLWMYLIRLE